MCRQAWRPFKNCSKNAPLQKLRNDAFCLLFIASICHSISLYVSRFVKLNDTTKVQELLRVHWLTFQKCKGEPFVPLVCGVWCVCGGAGGDPAKIYPPPEVSSYTRYIYTVIKQGMASFSLPTSISSFMPFF